MISDYLSLIFSCTEILFYAGATYGFGFMQYIFEQENVFCNGSKIILILYIYMIFSLTFSTFGCRPAQTLTALKQKFADFNQITVPTHHSHIFVKPKKP